MSVLNTSRIGCLIIFFLLGAVGSICTLHAQTAEWTPAQKEVWKRVEEYSDASRGRDLDAYLRCFHPDFVGWHTGMDTTSDKPTRGRMLAWYFENTTPVSMELEPISVQVYGTSAVVHYKIREVLSMKEGAEVPHLEYWTDVLIKENGEWLLIADHGGGITEE